MLRLARDWDIEKGNAAWETWIAETRVLAAQEAPARAEAAGVPKEWITPKAASAGKKGRGHAKAR